MEERGKKGSSGGGGSSGGREGVKKWEQKGG